MFAVGSSETSETIYATTVYHNVTPDRPCEEGLLPFSVSEVVNLSKFALFPFSFLQSHVPVAFILHLL